MTDLQKVEFDILKTVIEICDQLHLTYYLVCGSALGAVKYGGFIQNVYLEESLCPGL